MFLRVKNLSLSAQTHLALFGLAGATSLLLLFLGVRLQNVEGENRKLQEEARLAGRALFQLEAQATRLVQVGEFLDRLGQGSLPPALVEAAKPSPSEECAALENLEVLPLSEALKENSVFFPQEETPSLKKQVRSLAERLAWTKQYFDELLEGAKGRQAKLRSTPSLIPVAGGVVTSRYGPRRHPLDLCVKHHNGLDISAPYGSAILAAADGVVTARFRSPTLGRTVELSHGNGLKTRYAHNSKVLVRKGAKVRKGDRIAKLGNSGRSTGPHLHYEVRLKGRPVDPENFLPYPLQYSRRLQSELAKKPQKRRG